MRITGQLEHSRPAKREPRFASFATVARLLTIAIVLLIGGGTPLTTAAQGIEKYRYYLTATPRQSLEDLCVGDRVWIDVTANRFLGNHRYTDSEHVTNPPVQVFGVKLTATSGSPDVGTLSPATQMTAMRSSPPGSARFSFYATKPGFTTLQFTGTESRNWFVPDVSYLATELTATVKECEYDVTVVGRWSGSNIDYTAIIEVVRLRLGAQPGHYSGSAPVEWVVADAIARTGCSKHGSKVNGEVDVTAEFNGADELIVDVSFAQVTGTFFTYQGPPYCNDISSTIVFHNMPEALTFTLPRSGGTRHLPNTLVDNDFEILNRFGSAEVTVTPARSE
jgi:hypothetical protein